MVCDSPIRRWDICISGFLQHEGRPNGIISLWRKMRRLACEDIAVEQRPWNVDVKQLAELIWRLRPSSGSPDVRLYAYSWGVATAIRLARELKRRGITVRYLVSCDGVYRHPWLWVTQWRAFVSWSTLVVPDNVRQVVWFVQRQNRPCGHKIVAENPRKTTIGPCTYLHCEHQYADDASAFHSTALAVAATE